MTNDTMLSSSYSLRDFTKTNQGLTQPNMPDQAQFNNLVLLADVSEELTNRIGPFEIVSAFRTPELQQKLGETGAPTNPGALSYHEVGLAEDIVPTSMSIIEFFGKLLANDNLRNKFAEIIIKPGQGSIHLALKYPGDLRAPNIMALNASNEYGSLTESDIENYALPYYGNLPSFISNNPVGIGLGALAIVFIIGVVVLSNRTRTQSL